jgi:hypothetical protein
MNESAKTTSWGPDESHILSSLEAETPIQDVKIDELDGEDARSEIKPSSGWRSRKCAFLTSIVAIIVVTPLTILLPKKSSRSSSPFNITQFAESHIPPYSREAADRDSSSPQAKALSLINATASAADPIDRVQQRYALAVLYYSTAPSAAGRGIKDENECYWFNDADPDLITWDGSNNCDSSDQYLLLVLTGSSLTDTIPREVGMLTALQYLNFRGSSIHGTVPTEL